MTARPMVVALDRALCLGSTRSLRWIPGLANPEAATLPLNPAVLALIRARQAEGGCVYLLADQIQPAQDLAVRLGLFAGVIVPDHDIRENRMQAVRRCLGDGQFDVVGHDAADVPLWQAAERAWVVGGSQGLRRRVRAEAVAGGPNPFRALWRGMRAHHWAKNMLVFLPIIAAHQWGNAQALTGAASGFVIFCLVSSSVYLINDVFDLTDDRHHPHKRNRPVAAGHLSVGQAVAAAGVFLLLALMVSLTTVASALFGLWVAVYAGLALAYSAWLKTLRFADLLCLSLLYTLRVVAGAAAADIAVSGWLLALCLMLFLSLASAKRCAELALARHVGARGISRRGYRDRDARTVFQLGVAAAVASGCVFLVYAGTQAATLYPRPGVLALVAAWLMLWVWRIWRKVMSGQLGTDPILFALRDPVSWGICAALAATFVLAAV